MQNTNFEVTPEGGLIWQDKDALKAYLYSLIANYMTAAGVIKNESGEPIELDAETIHNYCKNSGKFFMVF